MVNTRYSSYPPGTYYITSEIRWDLNKSGSWRNMDHHKVQSPKYKINANRSYTIRVNNGDRTVWGASYNRWWKAHVIVKLMRVRSGPDKTVLREDRYYSRAHFRELGQDCSISF